MTQRDYCAHCQYPQKTCICTAIAPLNNRCAIDILQHPHEQKAAKNTARLVALCAQKTRIWVGEQPDDFTTLRQTLENSNAQNSRYTPVIVYPNNHSQSLSQWIQKINTDTHFKRDTTASRTLLRFIFLDGTWKKAYKLWQVNPWLHQYPSVHLTHETCEYTIRKAPKTGCLSTLEAVALCLKNYEAIDTQPLYDCFYAMQSHFLKHR